MKSRLLQILSKKQNRPVSGEILSSMTGISRVSIWKHIQKLRQLGYPIHSSPKGYQLTRLADALYPWEFPGRESFMDFHPTLDSTMDRAKELANNGCPDFTVVVADRQKRGRGRLSRSWHSNRGGLYFTIITRPAIPPVLVNQLSFSASVCLVETFKCLFDIDAKIKWPNDILLNNQKLSGILCEMRVEADLIDYLNIGIGINVNNNPRLAEANSVSIKQFIGRTISRKEILTYFLNAFEATLKANQYQQVLDRWKSHSTTLNQRVRVETIKETFIGKAVDIDDNGALILILNDNSQKKIYYGDCFHSQSQ